MAFGDDEAENGSQQSDGDEPEAKRWYVSPRFATHSQVEPYFLVPKTHTIRKEDCASVPRGTAMHALFRFGLCAELQMGFCYLCLYELTTNMCLQLLLHDLLKNAQSLLIHINVFLAEVNLAEVNLFINLMNLGLNLHCRIMEFMQS